MKKIKSITITYDDGSTEVLPLDNVSCIAAYRGMSYQQTDSFGMEPVPTGNNVLVIVDCDEYVGNQVVKSISPIIEKIINIDSL